MVLRKWESRSSPPKKSKARANARALFVISRRTGSTASAARIVLIVIIDTIVIIVIIDTIDAIDEIDIIDAIKYHLVLYGLKANNPINNPKISRLQRFFSHINEIILFILLLFEKKLLTL